VFVRTVWTVSTTALVLSGQMIWNAAIQMDNSNDNTKTVNIYTIDAVDRLAPSSLE